MSGHGRTYVSTWTRMGDAPFRSSERRDLEMEAKWRMDQIMSLRYGMEIWLLPFS